MEISQRFFVYDNFREQGNRKYNRKHPEEAIPLYEHALSCFRWLALKKEEKKIDEESKEDQDEDPLASLKPMNRALVTVLCDENVELHDGQELTESQEVDMRNSMLLNLYLALACSYLKLNHYGAALTAIEEGMKVNNTNSQLFFRRSQARAYNKGSTLSELNQAKEDIEKAIEIKHYEKIFQQEPGVQKILNIHNAGEVYVEHAYFVEKLVEEKRDQIKTAVKLFFAKVKEIEFIEEAMLKDGKVSTENDSEHAVEIQDEDNMEVEVIKLIVNKYHKIIEFYLETEKKDQIAIARKELQEVLDTYNRMKLFLNMDFKNYQNDPVIVEALQDYELDLSKPRTQKRLEKMKMNRAKDIFENGHFNLEVFQFALKDHFKRKEEKEKKLKEKKKAFVDDEKPTKAKWLKNLLGVEFGVQIAILVFLFGVFWYWNKSSFFSSTLA